MSELKVLKVRSKGDLMRALYTADEYRNLDSALPIAYWDGKDPNIQVNTATHVVNYNEPHSFGKLENMMLTARARGFEVKWLKQGEF